jgi:choline dehydrogenase
MDHPVTLLVADSDYNPDAARQRMAVTCKARSEPTIELDDLKISMYPGAIFNMPGLCGLYVEVNVSNSRGRVTTMSPDPAAMPRIDHNFLGDKRDSERMAAGIHEALRIAAVLGSTTRFEVLLPDPATASDGALLAAHMADYHSTGYHPSGTCRMGAEGDGHAVVDPGLRVHGCEGLYVADASVMPDIPRCNLNLPTLMIGERAAELVRAGL